MISAKQWREDHLQRGEFFGHVAHPHDYDPTDDELDAFIRAIQRDALEKAAALCDKASNAFTESRKATAHVPGAPGLHGACIGVCDALAEDIRALIPADPKEAG